jgi:UDP-N-acetylmuramate dehydrogenase
MNIFENISLKKYNTFGINVNARFLVEISSKLELINFLQLKEFSFFKKIIIGGGSNILLTKNFDGVVIKINISGMNVIEEDNDFVIIEAGAGVIWDELVSFCVDKNYGGVENLSFIPGTCGAAPMQNIGAYGQEIKDSFYSLEGITIDRGESKTFFNDQCHFGYRDSIFKNDLKNKFIITSIKLKLKKNPIVNFSYSSIKSELEKKKILNPTIKEIRKIIYGIRMSKLPDPAKIGNAGSFFKNPIITKDKLLQLQKIFPGIIFYPADENKIKLAAGWLIEQCGWKGKKIGNVGVHSEQALVLVNYGNASGDEILNLSAEIKKSVKDNFGVELKEEINIFY